MTQWIYSSVSSAAQSLQIIPTFHMPSLTSLVFATAGHGLLDIVFADSWFFRRLIAIGCPRLRRGPRKVCVLSVYLLELAGTHYCHAFVKVVNDIAVSRRQDTSLPAVNLLKVLMRTDSYPTHLVAYLLTRTWELLISAWMDQKLNHYKMLL